MSHVNPLLTPNPLGDAQDYIRRQVFGPKAAPFGLPPTGVAAGSYGDGTHSPVITVGPDGRLTAASQTTITGAAPTGSAGGDLGGTYPNPTVTPENASLLLAHLAFFPHIRQILEELLILRDSTYNNSSTARHGFLPKLDNTATHYMDGTGAWSTPAGTTAAASATEVKAASSTTVYISPGRAYLSPAAVSTWCLFDASSGTPTITTSQNVSSLTDRGVGLYTVNFSGFYTAGTSYIWNGIAATPGTTNGFCVESSGRDGTSLPLASLNVSGGSPFDASKVNFLAVGQF